MTETIRIPIDKHMSSMSANTFLTGGIAEGDAVAITGRLN